MKIRNKNDAERIEKGIQEAEQLRDDRIAFANNERDERIAFANNDYERMVAVIGSPLEYEVEKNELGNYESPEITVHADDFGAIWEVVD